VGSFYLAFAVPAVCAELAGLYADTFDHIVKSVIVKRSEVELLSDLFKHCCVLL
jgi:hypothetical protein